MRAAWLLAVAACTSASPDPGLDALLHVAGAQYRPGALPTASGGPDAVALLPLLSVLTVGEASSQLSGVLGPGSRAAVLGVAGVDGGWIVPAGSPPFDMPDNPRLSASYGVTADFPAGPFTLVMIAADADGRFGAPAAATMVANVAPPPTGELVLSLAWDGPADLDLHVVDALGGEAWADDTNTWVPPAPGEPPDPDGYLTGGVLDHDGNGSCHRDGAPSENVVWQQPPPAGDYVIRVDARSLCGPPSAAWYVSASRGDVLLGTARGVSTDADVQRPHRAGAGVLALRFTL